MNGNKLFFILFSILLIIFGLLNFKITGDFFLSSIIANPVWRLILLGVASFIFGLKYIKDIEKA